MNTTDNMEIQARTISGKSMRRRLQKRIRTYEQRYEMSSSHMDHMLECGNIRETAEIVSWMQAYHVLQFLNEKTRTNGTRGTTIEQSMSVE